MSNCLTRGVLPIAFLLLAVLCPAEQDLEKAHWKTYHIERTSAEEIRERLEKLMPDDLKRYTKQFVDTEKNELTVMGPLAAIEMADKFIPRMQEIKPTLAVGTLSPIDAFTRTPETEHSPPRGKVYRCAVRDVRAFEAELNRRFGNNPTVSFVFTDYVESQLLSVAVLAPEEVQTQFSETLQEMSVLLPPTQQPSEFQRNLAEISQYQYKPDDFDIVDRTYKPTKVSVGWIDAKLCEALKKQKRYTRISPPVEGEEKQTTGAAVYEYVIQTEERTRSVQVELNYDRREIFLKGDKRLCEQMLQLIGMIDRPKVPEGMDRRIFPIGGKQTQHLRQFADALVMQSPLQSPISHVRDSLQGLAAQPVPQFEQRAPSPQYGSQYGSQYRSTTPFSSNAPIQRVTYKLQQELPGLLEGGGGGGTFDQGIGGPSDLSGMPAGGTYGYEQVPGSSDPGFQIPQSMYINVLPELDIILFEGTTAESTRLQQMIKDIEQLMEDSKSQWKVVFLKNTDCISMNEMLFDMTNLLFFSRMRGRFNLFPLRNPNALMVAGWGAQFEEILKLIEALDTPLVEPGSCWKVIRLKYVSATYASGLLKEMYPKPPQPPAPPRFGWGWMPRIQTVVDTRTNSLIVHAGANDLREIEKFLSKIDLYESGPKLQIRQFRLHNSLANDVKTKLEAILAPGKEDISTPSFVLETLDEGERRLIESGIVANLKVNADVQQNTLLVTAPEYALPLIGKLIELLDSPVPTAEMRVIPLVYSDSKAVYDLLDKLIPAQIRSGQWIGAQMPGAKPSEEFVPLRFINEPRSNTIIAIGSKNELNMVQALVYQFDKDDSEKRIQRVYPLKNSKAVDVAKAINEYMKAKQAVLKQAPGGGVSTFLQFEEALIVVPEEKTNSLVIEARPRYFEEILKMVEKLDRQPDQVVIQVLIAEVTLSNNNEFGAEFGLQDSILFNRSLGGKPGFLFNNDPTESIGNNMASPYTGTVAPQILSNFNLGRVGSETGFGGMVFSANSESVSVLIRALEEKRKLEVLSRPQIMAMDNQMAFILIGERVSFAGGTTVGGYNTTQNVEREEVGLMLMVKPQISPDGKVVMDIGVEKSSVGSAADGTPIPDGTGKTYNVPKVSAITTRTNVTASNNETVLLGGLLSKETLCVNRRVPFIADIPVLGRLFQYKYDAIQKKELIIILTPQIVKYREEGGISEDAERIKREEAAKINWSLKEVIKMHGSPTGNNVRIWEPMAEQPVNGDVSPLYPTVPTPLESLQEMPTPPGRR
ncbi:MAG: hypothetical protein FWC43_09610 [Planctomycetaceae bacterium]|nr:hypothetical protein [Planctomycetaceae bacterium]